MVADNNFALRFAAENGHTEIVKLLLAKDESGNYIHTGVDVAADNNFALRWAARKGHTEIVKLLLAKDESGNYIHPGINVAADNNYALGWAAQNGHTEIVKLLLAKDESGNYIHPGVDVAADSNFALQWAAFNGHTEIVKLLLAKDEGDHYIHPSINVAVNDNYVLRLAAQKGHTEIVKLLLAKDRGNYIHPSITDDVVVNVMLTIYEGRDSLLKKSFLKAMLSLRVMASIVWEDRKIPRAIAQRRDLLSIIEESREETLKIMRICYDISLKTNHDNASLVVMFLYGKQLTKGVLKHCVNPYKRRKARTTVTDDVSMEDITYPSSSSTTPVSIEICRDTRPPVTIHAGAGAAEVDRMEGITYHGDYRTMSAEAPAGERDCESSQPARKRPRSSLS